MSNVDALYLIMKNNLMKFLGEVKIKSLPQREELCKQVTVPSNFQLLSNKPALHSGYGHAFFSQERAVFDYWNEASFTVRLWESYFVCIPVSSLIKWR